MQWPVRVPDLRQIGTLSADVRVHRIQPRFGGPQVGVHLPQRFGWIFQLARAGTDVGSGAVMTQTTGASDAVDVRRTGVSSATELTELQNKMTLT